MRSIIFVLTIVLCLGVATSGYAKEGKWSKLVESLGEKEVPVSYLCVGDKSTGFRYFENKGTWDTANFTVEDKYLLSDGPKNILSGKTTWELKTIGSDSGLVTGGDRFSSDVTIELFDSDYKYHFIMNKRTLRFLFVHGYGYWHNENDSGESFTPYMTIGKCSPL